MKINKYTFKNNTIAQKGETNKHTHNLSVNAVKHFDKVQCVFKTNKIQKAKTMIK